jgi:pSer/pThr/pTyr-binding forkhead associated (FHA) protein
MLRCIVCHNDEPVKTYELDEPVITIGRLPENTISIANMGVSRRHVRIERDVNRNYIVSDLNSLNGTFVNNKKVKKAPLNSGDRINIGKYTVIVEKYEAAPVHQNQAANHANYNNSQPEYTASPGAAQPQASTAPPHQSAQAQRPAAQQPNTNNYPVLIETSKHTVYPIAKRVMSLGSSESDDIFISGFLIGDSHMLIEIRDDGVWISAGKKSGKFKVNGKKTSTHRLKHKDRLEIGSCAFAYMENG